MPIAAAITAIVPVYNTPVGWLGECLGSLFEQTIRPEEILVIDDGSTASETIAYLDAQRELNSIRLVRTERNRGLSRTMNLALEQCRTPFVLKLDSDDRARPTLVAQYAAFLERTWDVDVLGCQLHSFGSTNFITSFPQQVTRTDVLQRHWFVSHTGVLLNRLSVQAVGGYRHLPRLAEDFELWLRLFRRGYRRFHNLPDILVEYRDQPAGMHRQISGRLNKAMKIWLRMLVRLGPETLPDGGRST